MQGSKAVLTWTSWGEGGYGKALTSLISLILEPPLPMREPHWLAGMTSRSVTGGLLVTVPFATRAAKSLRVKHRMNDVLTESCAVAFIASFKRVIILIQIGLEPCLKIWSGK